MKAAQQQAADKALADRDRLYRRYRAAKREQYAELFADPVHGDRLRKFSATLGHFSIEDGDRMVAYWKEQCARWLNAAPGDMQLAALQMLDERCIRLREKAGLPAFDDALPGEELTVFQQCREAVGV